MLVSVIIPACNAEHTLTRAINSLVAQTHAKWEAIIVSDDGCDYGPILGIADDRLRFVSTGQVRSGCHNARNVGFAHVRGDFVTQLDADDVLTPERFSTLLPLAQAHGAAADNLACISDKTGALLYRVMRESEETHWLDCADFLALSAPLVPLIRRDHAQERVMGVELAEDFIANLRLIDRIGRLPVTAQSSYIYNIVEGSICHDVESDRRFDDAYSAYIDRIMTGDAFGLSDGARQSALTGLRAKRELNRAFSRALINAPTLTFQEFAAAQ